MGQKLIPETTPLNQDISVCPVVSGIIIVLECNERKNGGKLINLSILSLPEHVGILPWLGCPADQLLIEVAIVVTVCGDSSPIVIKENNDLV